MPTFTDGQAVLVEDGLRFDLAKVLDAMSKTIDDCAEVFGTPIIRTIHEEYGARVPWDETGRAGFRDTWIRAGKVYDAVYEPMVVVFEAMCLRVFPLGTATCEYHAARDVLLTPSGDPISELDPTPRIMIRGRERGLNLFEIPSPEIVRIIEHLAQTSLSALGLEMRTSDLCHVSTDLSALGQFATLSFPHSLYGMGRGPIRVRCERKP
ncbi:MAG: hypothetical protein QY323_04005 [Patescibacteria group bacterium]|nr:MAG: hypothetical protein QY323_04005 [Patescibacteria group bacterium]